LENLSLRSPCQETAMRLVYWAGILSVAVAQRAPTRHPSQGLRVGDGDDGTHDRSGAVEPTGDPAARAHRPWLLKAGLALFGMVMLVLVVWWCIDTVSAAGSASWANEAFYAMSVGFGLMSILLFIIPGALLVLRHPWADVYLYLGGPYARLRGLYFLWTGLLGTGLAGAAIVLTASSWEHASTVAFLLVTVTAETIFITMVTLAPAIRFNRGREPTGG
jgi:hypothetical protein